MVKRLVRYLFSICLLLLIGLIQHQASASQSIARCPQFAISIGTDLGVNEGNFIFSASGINSKTDPGITVAEEVVEEEVSLSKKYLAVSNYFTSLFDSKSAIYFFECAKHRVQLFRKNAAFSSPQSLNIINEVFRL